VWDTQLRKCVPLAACTPTSTVCGVVLDASDATAAVVAVKVRACNHSATNSLYHPDTCVCSGEQLNLCWRLGADLQQQVRTAQRFALVLEKKTIDLIPLASRTQLRHDMDPESFNTLLPTFSNDTNFLNRYISDHETHVYELTKQNTFNWRQGQIYQSSILIPQGSGEYIVRYVVVRNDTDTAPVYFAGMTTFLLRIVLLPLVTLDSQNALEMEFVETGLASAAVDFRG